MSAINQAYINALLTDAAYVDVNLGMTVAELKNVLEKRMTSTLAEYIFDNFEVASAINTPDAIGQGSGFDATVWKGRAGSAFDGAVFVSTRGTEPDAGGQDLLADADLAFDGSAAPKGVTFGGEGRDVIMGGGGDDQLWTECKSNVAIYSRAFRASLASAWGRLGQKKHRARTAT